MPSVRTRQQPLPGRFSAAIIEKASIAGCDMTETHRGWKNRLPLLNQGTDVSVRVVRQTESFQTTVMGHVLGILGEHSRSFKDILAESRNCDPAFLMDVLREMEGQRLIHVGHEGSEKEYRLTAQVEPAKRVHRTSHRQIQSANERDSSRSILDSGYLGDLVRAVSGSLPEPGLVYSQWWFSELTYAKLAGLLLHSAREKARVAFLGASTLGAVFSHCGNSRITIVDIDDVLLRRISSTLGGSAQCICRDISDSLDASLKGTFDLVFADPPWSSSSLRTFFVRSAEMLARNGTLVISFPPVFTRPSVQTERRRLLRMAELLGLSFTTELEGFTEYDVPLFEHRAYREHGIELDRPWRKGDLFIFEKRTEAGTHVDVSIGACCKWDQYDCGTTRLFLKRNGSLKEGLSRIVPVSGKSDFTYDSTSSRTELWKQARLVSTRNQIADVSGMKQLTSILRRLAVRNSCSHADLKYLSDVLPQTRAALSVLLDDPEIGNSQEGESKWRDHQERNSPAT